MSSELLRPTWIHDSSHYPFQDIFSEAVQFWDKPLQDELALEWKALVNDLCCGGNCLSIPRHYFPSHDNIASQVLFGFYNASTRAYAAVIYLVTVAESSVNVNFIAAKTRVAPLQSQMIPRL